MLINNIKNDLKFLNRIQQCRYLLRRNFANKSNVTQNSSAADYCLDLVRRYDYENFLSTLLWKGTERQSAFAIRAFNVEISKISSAVSDDKIGIMRLKFWHDSIEKLYDKQNVHIPDHPVIKQLNGTIQQYQLPKIYLMRLIKARERPSNRPFITVTELEQYAEESVTSLYYLLLKLYNIKNVDVDHAISHLGKSQGIVNMLRSIVYLQRSHSLGVPQELLIRYGISAERVLRNKHDDKGVCDCIFDIASVANSHLVKARNLSNKVPKDIRHIFLPAIAIDRYLERLRKVDFHLSNDSLLKRDSALPLIYYWNHFRRKY